MNQSLATDPLFAFMEEPDLERRAAMHVRAYVTEGKRIGTLVGVGESIEILMEAWFRDHGEAASAKPKKRKHKRKHK